MVPRKRGVIVGPPVSPRRVQKPNRIGHIKWLRLLGKFGFRRFPVHIHDVVDRSVNPSGSTAWPQLAPFGHFHAMALEGDKVTPKRKPPDLAGHRFSRCQPLGKNLFHPALRVVHDIPIPDKPTIHLEAVAPYSKPTARACHKPRTIRLVGSGAAIYLRKSRSIVRGKSRPSSFFTER